MAIFFSARSGRSAKLSEGSGQHARHCQCAGIFAGREKICSLYAAGASERFRWVAGPAGGGLEMAKNFLP